MFQTKIYKIYKTQRTNLVNINDYIQVEFSTIVLHKQVIKVDKSVRYTTE